MRSLVSMSILAVTVALAAIACTSENDTTKEETELAMRIDEDWRQLLDELEMDSELWHFYQDSLLAEQEPVFVDLDSLRFRDTPRIVTPEQAVAAFIEMWECMRRPEFQIEWATARHGVLFWEVTLRFPEPDPTDGYSPRMIRAFLTYPGGSYQYSEYTVAPHRRSLR